MELIRPYCLKNTSGAACGECKENLPPLYVRNYGSGFARNPAIFSAVGFSGHGKTVYLAAMLHTMRENLTQTWPKFYRQALDVDSVRTVQQNLALLQKGDLPESTRRNFPKPSIHQLTDMPHYGTRGMLIYDPPGEAFETDEAMERYARFVQRARVVVFLVSLLDLQEPRADDLYRLLNTYVLGMAKMRASTKNQHLVIAYTKADRMIPDLDHQPLTLAHLRNAEWPAMVNPRKPMLNNKDVSPEIYSPKKPKQSRSSKLTKI